MYSPTSHSPSRDQVKDSLKELQLKVRLLEEERDYFLNLQISQSHAFEDHRNELNALLMVSREEAAKREQELEMYHQEILQENKLSQTEDVHQRQEYNARITAAMEQMQRDATSREQRVQKELELLRDELTASRRKRTDSEVEAETLTRSINTLKDRHSVLSVRSAEESAKNSILVDQAAVFEARQRAARNRHVTPGLKKGGGGGGGQRVKFGNHEKAPAFLPSGTTDKNHIGMPSSHHAHSVVQSIRAGNYRYHPPPQQQQGETGEGGDGGGGGGDGGGGVLVTTTGGGGGTFGAAAYPAHSEYELLCTSIMRELQELRTECGIISKHVGEGGELDDHTSKRLRDCFETIDKKQVQLSHLRQSQSKQEDHDRLSAVVAQVESDNNYCSTRMDELLSVIRADCK